MANCKYAQVDCIAGCGQRIQRRKVTDHVKKDCVKRWMKCPRCKKETTFEKLKVRSFTVQLSSYYTNSTPALWSCLASLEGFIPCVPQNHNCPATRRDPDEEIVTCSNGCERRLKRSQMPQHLRNECSHRWVYCDYCSVEIVYKDKQVCLVY